jgi:ABC-type hemin transport system substrate-binding protein
VAEAAALARESLAVFEAVAYPEGVTASLQTLGQVHLALGEAATATGLLVRAAGNASDLGHRAALAESLELLAEAVADGDPVAAARLLGHGEHLRATAGLPRTAAQRRRLDTWQPRLRRGLGERYASVVSDGRLWPVEDVLAAVGAATPAARPGERRVAGGGPAA